MRRLLIALVLLGVVTVVWGRANPYGSERGFRVHVEDIDVVNTSFELVTADTGFTQIAVDSVLYAFFDITDGDSSADTALVHIMGLRPDTHSDSLHRFTTHLKVAGGDTISTGSKADTFHVFEQAWLDSAMDGSIQIFHTYASVVMVDTLAIGDIHNPRAHVFFGRGDDGVIDYIDAELTSATGDMDCEFRIWHDVHTDVDYATDYEIAAHARLTAADGTSSGEDGFFSTSWGGRGIHVGQEGYAAWMCQGSADNADVAVTIVGRRRR
jgi:hypothetical protein